ncbi:hypothetical protein NKH77_19090 [Streptomyces sp. M19]
MLLAATGQDTLVSETPLAAFVRDAPRLDPHGPLRPQVEELLAGHRPAADPAAFVTSDPGASAALLRRHFYALMDLPEPAAPRSSNPCPCLRTIRRGGRPAARPDARTGADVVIERSTEHPYDAGGDTHLAVHEDTRDPGSLELADVIVRDGPADDPRLGGPREWTAEVLGRHAHCAVAAYVSGPDSCVARGREQGPWRLSAGTGADLDPAAYASSLYAWLAVHGEVPSGGVTLRVHAAGGVHRWSWSPLTGALAAQPKPAEVSQVRSRRRSEQPLGLGDRAQRLGVPARVVEGLGQVGEGTRTVVVLPAPRRSPPPPPGVAETPSAAPCRAGPVPGGVRPARARGMSPRPRRRE